MQEMEKVTKYKNNGLIWKLFILIFLLLIGFLIYIFFIQTDKVEGYRYVTKPIKKGDLVITVSATGNVQPVEEISVGSEVSGTIEKVFVDYNDRVKKGELLAQIDKTKYLSSYKKVKASLSVLQASLDNMNAQLYHADSIITRDKMLKKETKGILPSKSDWDKDWATYLSAKAQVASVKAQINQAKQDYISSEYDLQRTNVYSPVDGTILVRSIDPGQTVAASFQTPVLFLIAKDLTKMELQASIDEADIGKVKENQEATFSVDAYPNMIFHTKISQVRVNSAIVDGVVTFLAIMKFENKQLLLKPGMSADIDITTKNIKNAFIVPKSALIFIPIVPEEKKLFAPRKTPKLKLDPKPHLWILENGVPKKIYVQLLGSNGALSAIASDEIKENQQVIITQEKNK
jgi:HlyD family secretion protein